jgi:hypothetical protein
VRVVPHGRLGLHGLCHVGNQVPYASAVGAHDTADGQERAGHIASTFIMAYGGQGAAWANKLTLCGAPFTWSQQSGERWLCHFETRAREVHTACPTAVTTAVLARTALPLLGGRRVADFYQPFKPSRKCALRLNRSSLAMTSLAPYNRQALMASARTGAADRSSYHSPPRRIP